MPPTRQPHHQRPQKDNNNQGRKNKNKNTNNSQAVQQSAAEAAQTQKQKPILTFGPPEEHKATPAQAFASKNGRKRMSAKQNVLVGHNAGNKLKDCRNNYYQKHDFHNSGTMSRQFSAISEEKSFDEMPAWLLKLNDMEIVESLVSEYGDVGKGDSDNDDIAKGYQQSDDKGLSNDDYRDGFGDKVNAEAESGNPNFGKVKPTEYVVGSMWARLKPHSGMEVAGCSIKLVMTYETCDTTDMYYELETESADGLTSEQICVLKEELEDMVLNGLTYAEIIDGLQDSLGQCNLNSRVVLKRQNNEEEELKNKQRQDEIKRQRKETMKAIKEYHEQQMLLAKEEQRWFQSLADQQNNSRYRNTKCTPEETEPVTECETDYEEQQLDKATSVARSTIIEESKGHKKESEPMDAFAQVGQSQRYASDFEQLEEIGRGGFGIVYKARHRLDGNIYAIKKIKLADKLDSEEKRRILREITHLSSFNHQYIVRYFQTWIEQETDQEVIKEFDEWCEDYYDEEEDSNSSFEMTTEVIKEQDLRDKLKKQRSNSLGKAFEGLRDGGNQMQPMFDKLRATDVEPDEELSSRKQRANTDQFSLTPEQKPLVQKKLKQHNQKLLLPESDYDDEDDLLMQSEMGITEISPEDEDMELHLNGAGYSEVPLQKNGSAGSNTGMKIMYISMQYCDGETLQEFLMNNPGKQKEKQKWKIFRQVLEAVEYLHTRNTIHRDIKPENIFLDHNLDVRLGDFGLAKRVTTHIQKQDKMEAPVQEQTPDMMKACSMVKQMTTGVGTLRFAAPEQYRQGDKKKKVYCFKADIYSLGVVLLDLFRDHDISGRELMEIHESVKNQMVPEGLAYSMPPDARILIEKMIRTNPDERPNLLEVLTSESLPQDDVLKNLLPHLQNHKSSVKLQLMHHLSKLQFPKTLDLQYHGNWHEILNQLLRKGIQAQQTVTQAQELMSPLNPIDKKKRKNQEIARKKNIIVAEKNIEREAQQDRLERRVTADLRKIFESNGARCLTNLPSISPFPNERTIFMSKAMRLAVWLGKVSPSELENDSVSLQESLCDAMGSKCGDVTSRLLTDDFLVLDGNDDEENEKQICNQKDHRHLRPRKVKSLFEFRIPREQNESGKGWQTLKITNMPELLQSKTASKLIDENGIVVSLQPNLIDTVSRQMAYARSKLLQKVYHIGPTYTSEPSNVKLAPKSENKACFALVSPVPKKQSEVETLSQMSDEEHMLEVEMIRICDLAFKRSKLQSKYEIRVSSSELLDALFEECNIDLADRIPVLQSLFEYNQSQKKAYKGTSLNFSKKGAFDTVNFQKKGALDMTGSQELTMNTKLRHGSDLTKLKDLMRIRGSCDQIEKLFAQKQHIFCKPRFVSVLNYFRRLEDTLKLFEIYSEVPDDGEKPIETWKAQAAKRGESQSSVPRSKSGSKKSTFIKSLNQLSGSNPAKLVFDFGLVLQDCMTHYSGLLCSVTVKQLQQKKNSNQEVVLASGGRFDNNIANFQQLELQKYQPACVGVTFNCSQLASQILAVESKEKLREQQSSIDFCVGSDEATSLIPQKIQLMQLLQLEGYRVHVDYSNDMHTNLTEQFFQENNVRFIVQPMEGSSRILFADRFGYLSGGNQSAHSTAAVYTQYADLKHLMSEFATVKTRNKRNAMRMIMGESGTENPTTTKETE